jgi:hypothetical protein
LRGRGQRARGERERAAHPPSEPTERERENGEGGRVVKWIKEEREKKKRKGKRKREKKKKKTDKWAPQWIEYGIEYGWVWEKLI